MRPTNPALHRASRALLRVHVSQADGQLLWWMCTLYEKACSVLLPKIVTATSLAMDQAPGSALMLNLPQPPFAITPVRAALIALWSFSVQDRLIRCWAQLIPSPSQESQSVQKWEARQSGRRKAGSKGVGKKLQHPAKICIGDFLWSMVFLFCVWNDVGNWIMRLKGAGGLAYD